MNRETKHSSHQGKVVTEKRVVRNSGYENMAIAHKVTQVIWLLGGLLEVLLGLRFILKLIAANPSAPFANLIYSFSDLFMWPFVALTVTPSTSEGIVLEIPTLIAMVVYAFLTWAAAKIIRIILQPTDSETVSTYQREVS